MSKGEYMHVGVARVDADSYMHAGAAIGVEDSKCGFGKGGHSYSQLAIYS